MWRDQNGILQEGIAKVRYTHEALADLILADPSKSQREYAAHFGYTEGWLSQILASDSFQAYLSTRKEEIVDPILRGAVEESFKGLVLQSVSILKRKLEANPTDDLVLEVFKNSARALGYGARVQVSGNIQHDHKHSLLGVLSSLPPASRVVEALPSVPEPAT